MYANPSPQSQRLNHRHQYVSQHDSNSRANDEIKHNQWCRYAKHMHLVMLNPSTRTNAANSSILTTLNVMTLISLMSTRTCVHQNHNIATFVNNVGTRKDSTMHSTRYDELAPIQTWIQPSKSQVLALSLIT